MISFESDYNNGAAEEVLRALIDTNGEQSASYGADRFSESARRRIREACGTPDAQVFFLAGGTQTNQVAISGLLQSYEGVVAVKTAHIAAHEAGAIEYSGHKVLQMEGHEGKMDTAELEGFLCEIENEPSADHCVYAGMVYITFPTELGTIYSAGEIAEIHRICRKHGIPLYIDGARLGYGLAASRSVAGDYGGSREAPVDLPFLASHCDCFYIGGTKQGALCGEALVFPNGDAPRHFFTCIKQRGALLAKSRCVGVQFDALFKDGLYLQLSEHAIRQAMKLRKLFSDAGVPFYIDSPTNQQFVILDDSRAKAIMDAGILFEKWVPLGSGRSSYRFVTSWRTTDSDIAALADLLLG